MYRGEWPKKEELGKFTDLREGLDEKEGGVFEGVGVDNPMHTMDL